MAQLNDLVVTGKSRFLNEIQGNISGTASNVTGTVAIAHGGTGATTRLGAAKNLTDETVPTPGFVVGLTDNWGKFGYTSIANLKTTLGSMTPASHTHGNIQNGGTLQTTDVTIANGDKLVVTDSSDSSKIARTSISFDGSTTTQCLTKKGTWATFGTSNLTIGTTASTAMAGNTNVNNVTQTASLTANTEYGLLLTNSALDSSNHTEGARKSSYLKYSEVPGRDSSTCGTLKVLSGETSARWGVKISQCDIELITEGYEYDWTWDGTNSSLVSAVTSAKDTVKQNVLSTPSTNSYKLLLSGSADASAHTEGVYKYSTLEFTPDNNESALDGNTLSLYNNSWETVIRLSCGTHPYVYVKDSSTTCLKAYNSNMIIGNNISNPTKYVQSGLDSTDSTPFVELRDTTSDTIYSWSRIKPEEIKVAKSKVGSMSIQPSDIVNGSTWDGTNTSLKTTLTNKISKETNTTVSWTSSATGRTVTCMLAKIGTIVICTITGSTDANHSITAWTATQLGAGQIPAGYRPSSATEGRIPTQTGGAVITVNTVGTVAITTWNNLGGQMAFGGTFWWKTS